LLILKTFLNGDFSENFFKIDIYIILFNIFDSETLISRLFPGNFSVISRFCFGFLPLPFRFRFAFVALAWRFHCGLFPVRWRRCHFQVSSGGMSRVTSAGKIFFHPDGPGRDGGGAAGNRGAGARAANLQALSDTI
jgi:hypothetical protein